MIQRLLMLSWVGNSRRSAHVYGGFALAVAKARRLMPALALACVLNSGLSAVAGAESTTYAVDFRRNGPLFQGLAEPPPVPRTMIDGKAPLAQPVPPLLFSGVVHITDPAFESNDDYLIGGGPVIINAHEGATAHFSGVIGNAPGSPHGLTKLGAGTLALSGANTYSGASGLLQGGLQVRGHNGWGWASLHASAGTWLEYAPEVVVASPLHISTLRIEDWAPPGSYGTVSAPEHADKLRWVVQSGIAVHGGLLQGDAPFVKQGAGRLSIAGDALGYSGAALVEQGALAINELFGGSVRVGAGARLEGEGMVASAQVLHAGTLAPGNSIGTLSIMGDLVLEPGSRFEAEVDPSGAADFVLVGGRALLAGDVLALARAGVWRPSTSYTLLRADQGFDGSRFDSVSVPVDFAFLEPRLSYESNAVLLTLARNDTPLADVADNPDDEEVAEAIDEEVIVAPGTPPTESAILRDEILLLTRADARGALRQLSGHWSASVLSSLTEDSRFVREGALANARVRGFWSHGFYSSAKRGAVDGVLGDTRSLQGLLLGVNRALGGWTVGGLFGVQQAVLRREGPYMGGDGGHAAGGLGWGPKPGASGQEAAAMAVTRAGWAWATVQSTHLGAVASAPWRGLRFSAGASHTWHGIKSRRHVAFGGLDNTLNARYRADTTQGFAEASWPVWLSNAPQSPPEARGDEPAQFDQGGPLGRPGSLWLEPFARLAYISVHSRGFDEAGGPAALSVLPARHSLRFSTVGLRLEQAIETAQGTLRLQGQLAWRYADGAREMAARQFFRYGAGRGVFTSQGLPVARSAWSLDLSLAARISKRVSAMLVYAGQFAKASRDHGVQLSLQWAF